MMQMTVMYGPFNRIHYGYVPRASYCTFTGIARKSTFGIKTSVMEMYEQKMIANATKAKQASCCEPIT